MTHTSPARLAVAAFLAVVLLVALALWLPIATTSGHSAPFIEALFTATSAVSVTGLTSVDTAAYWSDFGHGAILVGIQVGGLGIMTLGSILSLVTFRRLGLRTRLMAASETKTTSLGEVGLLVRAVAMISLVVELTIGLVLFSRFIGTGEPLPRALWHAVFYGVSTFNNAGFSPTDQGLVPYIGDWGILVPIGIGVFIGSLGFPVILDVVRHLRHPRQWNLHTKLTLTFALALLVVGAVVLGATEWNNPATLANQSTSSSLLNSFFSSANTRSGGFSTYPIELQQPATIITQEALMFIGGGSASTAGGIKVTTLAVMLLAILAEARGDRDMEAFRRRIDPSTLRVAITVTTAGMALILGAVLGLSVIGAGSLEHIVFESISAFATCGLSTGLSQTLPWAGKLILIGLMLAGRLGTMTIAASVALTNRHRLIRLPQERPIIG
ncbi:MAG: TrkH family potassium uptake protein [Micrococcales bacterium]|nr:TrkH family potassium uptake protein [Micrococcales bacterium]